MAARYKHQSDFDVHAPTECPPDDAKPIDTDDAFRFVRKPVTARDFHTHIQLKLLPKKTAPIHDKNRCSKCGLSMFTTLDAAIKKYKGLPKVGNFQYTHVAKGTLSSDDGVCTTPINGHFTFHEYDGVDIVTRFKIVAELSKWKS